MARPSTGRDQVLTARVDDTTMRVVRDRAKETGKSTSETAHDLIRAGLNTDEREALEAQRKGLGPSGYAWLVDQHTTNAQRIIHELLEANPNEARTLAVALALKAAHFAALVNDEANK